MREAFMSIHKTFGISLEGMTRVAEERSLGILAHVDAGKTSLTGGFFSKPVSSGT